MEISQISFCNKIGYNITNDKEKEHILQHFIHKYDIELNAFSMYYYSDAFLKHFKQYKYMLSLESNGNKYYLLLITIKNERYSIFVDTKTTKSHAFPKMIIVPFRFSEDLYTDTIIEGSLIRDKHKQWVFVWENLMVYKGQVCKDPLITKYKHMYSILEDNYIEDLDIQVCPIHIKRLFMYDEIEYIFNTYIHSLDYNSNGLVFHPLQGQNKSVVFYFNLSKHTKHNSRTLMNFEREKTSTSSVPVSSTTNLVLTEKKDTIGTMSDSNMRTFIIKHSKKTNYIYNLYCIDNNNKIKKYAIARIDSIDKKNFIENKLASCKKHLFVTCSYSPEFSKWIPQSISTQEALSRIQDIQTMETMETMDHIV